MWVNSENQLVAKGLRAGESCRGQRLQDLDIGLGPREQVSSHLLHYAQELIQNGLKT